MLTDDGSIKIDGREIVIRLDMDGAEWLRDQLPNNDQWTALLSAKIIEAALQDEPTEARNEP